MNDKELAARLLSDHKMKELKRRNAEAERSDRLKGYRFWCSEGCGFVDENHKCEQWSHITYVSPELFRAIKKEKTYHV